MHLYACPLMDDKIRQQLSKHLLIIVVCGCLVDSQTIQRYYAIYH